MQKVLVSEVSRKDKKQKMQNNDTYRQY